MEKEYLSIGEFSRLSGIARKTLIYYDREGIFSPVRIGPNQYRLYSPRQLHVANVIVSLRAIDVSLPEIRAFLRDRSPEALLGLCRLQERRITAELGKLSRVREVIRSLAASTGSAAAAKPGKVAVCDLPPARLFMGPEIGSTDIDAVTAAWIAFYELCVGKGVPFAHPLGSVTDLADSGGGNTYRPSRYYCPAGSMVSDDLVVTRPGGRYVMGWAHGDYDTLEDLYRRILRYARAKKLVIDVVAYEEYVLNEMALMDPDHYLARVFVRITETPAPVSPRGRTPSRPKPPRPA